MHRRQDVNALFAGNPDNPVLGALRRGVAEMKRRSSVNPDDPTGWLAQARIHGAPGGLPNPHNLLRNQCVHSSYFFLSWHRMYLYFFERILRSASGMSDFALPYWNYSVEAGRAIPQPFRVPDSSTNPLFASRRAAINNGDKIKQELTSLASVRDTNRFYSLLARDRGLVFGGIGVGQPPHEADRLFVGAVENVPHNTVHDAVGGLMMDPNTAAQDPLFWLHHANIDRLWEAWLRQPGGNRSNPSDDAHWMTFPFRFYDEQGVEQTMTGSQIVDTAGQLEYEYDDLSVPPSGHPLFALLGPDLMEKAREAAGAGAGEWVTVGCSGPVRLDRPVVELSVEPDHDAAGLLREAGRNGDAPRPFTLTIEHIVCHADPGLACDLYLSPPEGADPAADRSRFVGTIGFFGLLHAHAQNRPGRHGSDAGGDEGRHTHPCGPTTRRPPPLPSLSFDITPHLYAQAARGDWDPTSLRLAFVFQPRTEGERIDVAQRMRLVPPVEIARVLIDTPA